MAQKVTAMDIRMAAALAGQVDNVAEFCRREQISRQTFYKFRHRFRDGGHRRAQRSLATAVDLAGADLRPRSRSWCCAGASSCSSRAATTAPQSIVWSLQARGPTPAAAVVASHGVADPDPPRGDHPAAAETAEVSDETLHLRPTQRVLAVGLDRMVAGRWQPGGYRGHPR